MRIPTHSDQLAATRESLNAARVELLPVLKSLLVTMSTEQLAAVARWVTDAHANGVDGNSELDEDSQTRTTDRLNHL